MRSSPELNYVDLFSGCGGLSEGLEQAGAFNLLAAVEWNKAARDTFVTRLVQHWKYSDAEKRVLWYDIQKTKELFSGWNDPIYGASEGLDGLIAKRQKVHAVVGGPPCQAYSVAGRIRDSHGMRNDYRNYLFESYIRVVEKLRPDFFIFENVEGMLSAKPGGIPIIDRIRSAFDDAGYFISNDLRGEALFDLSEYGVPQRRKRVIILGISKKTYSEKKAPAVISKFYSEFLKNKKRNLSVTVKEAIGDLPMLKPISGRALFASTKWAASHAAVTVGGIPNHSPRYHNSRDIEIFKELAMDVAAGSKKYPDIRSLHKLYTEKTGRSSNIHKYYVLRWDAPSNAIVAHLHKDGLRHIHPDYRQARSITVREAARLQTFPDSYFFKGGQGEQFKMIGNAVPPHFAKIVGAAVRDFISSGELI